MLRILFDKNVPYPLRPHLTGFEVKTAEDEGWCQIANGELISRAEKADYQVLLTCDQNVHYQQNLTHRKISMVVLGSNIWPSISVRIDEIVAALEEFRQDLSSSSRSLPRRSVGGYLLLLNKKIPRLWTRSVDICSSS